MKLRITNDNIRIRLNQSDIDILKLKGLVEINIMLGPEVLDAFKTSVILTDSLFPTIKMMNKHIRVYLPSTALYNWSGNQEEIIFHEFAFSDAKNIKLSIEFDLPCFHESPVNI